MTSARKIMIICGSPRRDGNTSRVARWFAEAAGEAGAEVEIVDAARLSYRTNGCTACMSCQKSEHFQCAVEDEAQPILARIPQMDILVIATPVYWFSPTAQTKLFVDRMFSLIKSDPRTGAYRHPLARKTLVLIATGGGDMESGLNAVDLSFRTAAAFLEMRYESLLVPFSPADPAEMDAKAEVREEARELGRSTARA